MVDSSRRVGDIIIYMKTYNVIITEENGWLIALEPFSGVASQGQTLEQAMNNIREALELYFEELGDTKISETTTSHTFLTTVNV